MSKRSENEVYAENQISQVLTHLAQNVMSIDAVPTLTLGVAALMAGEMPIWMGPGRRFIEASWEVCVLERDIR